jgi:hypothetical protein
MLRYLPVAGKALGSIHAGVRARTLGAEYHGVTTIVRPWFGRGTSNLARECDRRRGSGLRPRLEDVRPV